MCAFSAPRRCAPRSGSSGVADGALPRTVGLLGAGVIGAGWAARFVLHGVDVRLYDPDERAEEHVRAVIENARRAYAELMTAPLPAEGDLTVTASPEEAARDAGFVQESVPEREALKRDLIAAAGSVTPAGVVIASSTSGLLPSRLQAGVPHPERVVVGHPFHPVYLLPLVEVCGGSETSPAAVESAEGVYRSLGMSPLRVRKEIDGFVADRLLEALWREALWLVADGVATVGEIDDAIRLGAGLRWSFMGTFLAYRMAGGDAGMRGFLEHFGPALEWPWTKLTDVPELTGELVDRITAQSDAQAAGRSLRELERERDDRLVAVLQALRSQDAGAGKVLAAHEARLKPRHTGPWCETLASGTGVSGLEQAVQERLVDRLDDLVGLREAIPGERPGERDAPHSGGLGRGDPRLGVLERDHLAGDEAGGVPREERDSGLVALRVRLPVRHVLAVDDRAEHLSKACGGDHGLDLGPRRARDDRHRR